MKIQRVQIMKILLAIAVLISHLPIATPVRAECSRSSSTAFAASTFAAPVPQESPTPSPSPTPTPDVELEEAKRAALIAEEKKKKEQADKDAAAARNELLKATIQPLGEPKNVSVPTGSVQTDAAGWAESQVLAQEGALKAPKTSAAQKKKLRAEIKALAEAIKVLDGEINDTTKNIKKIAGKENATPEEVALIVRNSENFEEWKKLLTKLKTETEQLITSTEQFIIKLNTPEEGTKLTALARLLRAERLQCIMSMNGTYTLRVAVTANGTTKIKKNLFVDAKVRHSARAGLVYQLFDKFGRVVKGSSMQCYIDYQSARNVRDAVSGLGAPVICRAGQSAPPQ